jgi:hypothetical protein
MLNVQIAVLLALLSTGYLAMSEDGRGIDPNGGRPLAARLDHGCTIDPNGACTTASTIDRGAGLDPNG